MHDRRIGTGREGDGICDECSSAKLCCTCRLLCSLVVRVRCKWWGISVHLLHHLFNKSPHLVSCKYWHSACVLFPYLQSALSKLMLSVPWWFIGCADFCAYMDLRAVHEAVVTGKCKTLAAKTLRSVGCGFASRFRHTQFFFGCNSC